MNLKIRKETPADAAAIAAVTVAAFRDAPHASSTEHVIVKALRHANALSVSLVAEWNGVLIGHVAVSPVTVSEGISGWYGLGPISVQPEFQRRGIGSQLMHAALDALREIGAAGCVLVGDPAYYRRFGFKPDPRLTFPEVAPEYFLVLAFGQELPRGVVAYHEAFGAQE